MKTSILISKTPRGQFNPLRTQAITHYAAAKPLRAPQSSIADCRKTHRPDAICHQISAMDVPDGRKVVEDAISVATHSAKKPAKPVGTLLLHQGQAQDRSGVHATLKAGYASAAVRTRHASENTTFKRMD